METIYEISLILPHDRNEDMGVAFAQALDKKAKALGAMIMIGNTIAIGRVHTPEPLRETDKKTIKDIIAGELRFWPEFKSCARRECISLYEIQSIEEMRTR